MHIPLTFCSYQESQGGRYECRVAGPGDTLEKLPVCIGETQMESHKCKKVQYIAKRHNFASILSSVGPTHKSCTDITGIPTTSSKGKSSTRVTHLTDASTEHPPNDSSTEAPNGHSKEPLTVPSTESSTETPKRMTAPVPTAQPPCKVAGVHVTSNTGVQNTSPTLTVMWHALASGALTYTVKYSTQPGELNTPPEEALEVTGISGTSTILNALK